jgi:acetone carboxylase gamma subunit
MRKSDSHYAGLLWEEINERLKLIQEVLSGFKDMQADVKHMKERLDKVDDWHDVAKLVIKDHSKVLNNHQTRLTKLETA